MKDVLNDWEQPLDNSKMKEAKEYNLDNLYKHAHSELSLQQTKRDQIITLYLALCSFLVPFALGEDVISWDLKGVIFIVIGIVGTIFSLISIRYREYKEVYWLCCQTITVLKNFKNEEINKLLIQKVFYHCLHKKGSGFTKVYKNDSRLNFNKYARKNIFSSETMYFMIIDLMATFIFSLGVSLIVPFSLIYQIICGVGVGIILFLVLLTIYFKVSLGVYKVLSEEDKTKRDQAFSKVFSKAWFLHVYYEPKTNIHANLNTKV